jgi:hypothetical protein
MRHTADVTQITLRRRNKTQVSGDTLFEASAQRFNCIELNEMPVVGAD